MFAKLPPETFRKLEKQRFPRRQRLSEVEPLIPPKRESEIKYVKRVTPSLGIKQNVTHPKAILWGAL